ncbi:MAG: hypothetical protein K5839_00320 [Treponemataceae bacterium]|nr:hypothetical protein [Treponemataceae bacterium]
MKKIIIALISVSFLAAASFACTYDPETHKLTECLEYQRGDGESPEECKKAHAEYNKYVAGQLGKKAKNGATRVGNSILKFLGDHITEDESEESEESKETN